MERLTLEQLDHGIESDARDPLLQALANRGMQHERGYLAHPSAQGLDIAVIEDTDLRRGRHVGHDAGWRSSDLPGAAWHAAAGHRFGGARV